MPRRARITESLVRPYSHDQECAFVITVSEDRPVTVFADVARAIELAHSEPGDPDAYLQSQAAKQIGPDALTDVVDKKCPTCGSRSRSQSYTECEKRKRSIAAFARERLFGNRAGSSQLVSRDTRRKKGAK
jgi:hypothetical protein